MIHVVLCTNYFEMYEIRFSNHFERRCSSFHENFFFELSKISKILVTFLSRTLPKCIFNLQIFRFFCVPIMILIADHWTWVSNSTITLIIFSYQESRQRKKTIKGYSYQQRSGFEVPYQKSNIMFFVTTILSWKDSFSFEIRKWIEILPKMIPLLTNTTYLSSSMIRWLMQIEFNRKIISRYIVS